MKKKNWSNIILIVVFFVGLSVLLYPTVSDYWNSLHQSRAIATYSDAVEEMDTSDYERMWAEADAYNEELYESGHGLGLAEDEKKEYDSILDVSGTGIMSYIEILFPSIMVRMRLFCRLQLVILREVLFL